MGIPTREWTSPKSTDRRALAARLRCWAPRRNTHHTPSTAEVRRQRDAQLDGSSRIAVIEGAVRCGSKRDPLGPQPFGTREGAADVQQPGAEIDARERAADQAPDSVCAAMYLLRYHVPAFGKKRLTLRIDPAGEFDTAVSLAIEHGRITRIYAIRNPQKLARLDEPAPLAR